MSQKKKAKKVGRPKLPKQSPATPAIRDQQSIWKRASSRIVVIIGLIGTFVTLTILWPWISIDKSGTLDANNPFGTLFYMVNEGLLPLTDISATCIVSAKSSSQHVTANRLPVTFTYNPERLSYKHRFTIPCYHVINDADYDSAFLEISIAYRVFHIPVHLPQTFKLGGTKLHDGTWEWIFMG